MPSECIVCRALSKVTTDTAEKKIQKKRRMDLPIDETQQMYFHLLFVCVCICFQFGARLIQFFFWFDANKMVGRTVNICYCCCLLFISNEWRTTTSIYLPQYICAIILYKRSMYMYNSRNKHHTHTWYDMIYKWHRECSSSLSLYNFNSSD